MPAARRWTVRAEDGARVADILARLGDELAADDGRAHLNGRRAVAADPIVPGDCIEIFAARSMRKSGGEEATRILARRGGLIVAWKPASLPTTADRRGVASLVADLARAFGEEPHPASRLDVGVSGAVLCALGEKARRHVARVKETGEVQRIYVGIAGGPITGKGVWDAPIGRARSPLGKHLPAIGGNSAQPARTRYAALARARATRPNGSPTTMLRLEPLTGRMHQLRVHAASAGAPLLGDRDHGGARTIVAASGEVGALDRVALHAAGVALPDEQGVRFAVDAPVPESLSRIWKSLDGDEGAWEEVLPRGFGEPQ